MEENVLGKTQKYLKFRAKKKVKKSERQKTKFEKNSSQMEPIVDFPSFLANPDIEGVQHRQGVQYTKKKLCILLGKIPSRFFCSLYTGVHF